MRLILFFVLFVTSLPATTPTATLTVFELGAKILELTQELLDTLAAINEHEDLKETLLFATLDNINLRVGAISEQLHGISYNMNIIVQILRSLPDTIRLELNLNAIRTKQIYIDMYYNRMEKYVMDFDEYANSTLVEFAKTVVSDNPNSVPHLIEGIYGQVTRSDFLDLFCQYFQPTPESYFCKGKQSLPQVLHNFMNEIIMLNTKSYILTQAAYMIKKIYKKDQTFVEVTNFLHGFILNKVNLDTRGKCRDECDVYTYTLGDDVKCRDNKWCKTQVTCPKIIDCHYVDSSMTVCPSKGMSQDGRRYEYIGFGSSTVYGKKTTCNKPVPSLQTYRDWIVWRCSYCFCLCDEGPKYFSDRYINLLPTKSNTTANKVVTGVRFVKRKQIIYLQVQEGKLLPYGQIDLDTIRWVPLTEYARTNKNNDTYYHTLSWEERGFDLGDILVDDGYVLTGVKFTKVGEDGKRRIQLEVRQTAFNFATGKLIKKENDLKHDPFGKELQLSKPDVSTRSKSISTEITTNKYVQITHTDFEKDAGQTAVPFFDAQPVESATPVPLQGIGIFHKGRRGYGGFITPKIFTYNFTQHLGPVFPRNKQGKLRNN